MARASKDQVARRKHLAVIAERFQAFRPAREVLKVVRAVPTCFVQLDHATRVGGFPIDRLTVIHGPSNEGKSLLALGLCRSFVERRHFALYVDAERTTPITWAREVMGPAAADSERFFATRPDTYEKTVDAVRDFVRGVADLRDEGKVVADTTAIVVVDSLRKLVPEDIFKKISKHGAAGEKGSVDGMGGRAAQIRAALNAAWLDELTPLLEATGTAVVFIAREAEDPDADFWDKKFGNDYKVGGGRAVIYDSSLLLRVQRAGWVTDERAGKKVVLGERHRITIRKTKIGDKDDRSTVCYFHSHNGKHYGTDLPAWRLDGARDLVDLGERVGVLAVAGGRVRWEDRKAAPLHDAVAALAGDPEARAALEAQVRAKFDDVVPAGHDADGVVLE